jgi:hypothetical protein
LSLHVKGNLAFLAVLIPAILVGATLAGAKGAAIVWLATNLVFLLGWVNIVHRRFLPDINRVWYTALAARIALLGGLGWLMSRSDLSELARPMLFVALAGYWSVLTAAAIAASPLTHRKAWAIVGRFVSHS